jgi:hypothetical protein
VVVLVTRHVFEEAALAVVNNEEADATKTSPATTELARRDIRRLCIAFTADPPLQPSGRQFAKPPYGKRRLRGNVEQVGLCGQEILEPANTRGSSLRPQWMIG